MNFEDRQVLNKYIKIFLLHLFLYTYVNDDYSDVIK